MGINDPSSDYYISPATVVVSVIGIILATASYFFVPQRFNTATTYVAYWALLIACTLLTSASIYSPFIALWMIAVIFAGMFGRLTIVLLLAIINTLVAIYIFGGNGSSEYIISVLVALELPIVVSYVLWHTKSSTEKNKERAYSDLANELDQMANKSEVVINAISDGVIAISNSGTIELINPAAQRILGWDAKDAMNLDYKSVLQLLTANSHEVDKSNDPVFSVLTTNQPTRNTDLQIQSNSGKKIAIELLVSPIGKIGSGAIIVFRDIAKQLIEEKAQAEFISTASHEMRTPVASIEGYLGLALNPATATIDEKAREFIVKAHESAQHLGRLFQDLLDVTKADDGRLANNPKVVNLVDFTEGIVDSLRPKADEKQLRLFFKPATSNDPGGKKNLDPVFYSDIDNDHLREVLANLVENAIKYTPKGEVVIDVQGDDEHVLVTITDSGIGIPSEDIPHLFQKFYRVDNSDTREIGGTGLGLYLCRRLVEAMGGRIWVDSEYKKGSTFSVELPRLSANEAQRLIEAASSSSIKPIETSRYIAPTEEGANVMTPAEKEKALATPIILSRSAPARLDHKVDVSSKSAAPETESTDPLMGTPAPALPLPAPVKPESPIVLPPSMQAVQSNLQTAEQSKPTPATSVPQQPIVAPTPAPQPQQPAAPVVAQPAAPTPQPVSQPLQPQASMPAQQLSPPSQSATNINRSVTIPNR